MQMVDGQSISSIFRCHMSQLNNSLTIIAVAFLYGKHSPFGLMDFGGGPFHVADTVFPPQGIGNRTSTDSFTHTSIERCFRADKSDVDGYGGSHDGESKGPEEVVDGGCNDGMLY